MSTYLCPKFFFSFNFFFFVENEKICAKCENPLFYKLCREIYLETGATCDLCENDIGTGDEEFLWHCSMCSEENVDICTVCISE